MPKGSRKTVRMRPHDSTDDTTHLLEELSKPLAALNRSSVTFWVYRHNGRIREIVLAGHAESATCGAVTSRLMQAVKELDESVSWMIACGAGFIRVPEAGQQEGEEPLLDLMRGAPSGAEAVLRRAVEAVARGRRHRQLPGLVVVECRTELDGGVQSSLVVEDSGPERRHRERPVVRL